MKQIALEEHLINRLNELKEERKSLKRQKLRSIKETIDVQFILSKFIQLIFIQFKFIFLGLGVAEWGIRCSSMVGTPSCGCSGPGSNRYPTKNCINA